MGEAIVLVSKSKLGLVVAVENGRVAGIITDGDVRRAMEALKDGFATVPASQVMSRQPKCVTPDTKLADIMRMMHAHKIHAVLVVDQERHLIGVVDSFSCMI